MVTGSSQERPPPTWQTLKGLLIHRCVLAAAGKWLKVSDALYEEDDGEPLFVREARWMARQLAYGFRGNAYLARALIDSGGPYWIETYWDFVNLKSESDKEKVLSGLVRQSTCVAEALLEEAGQDEWEYMLGEVQNPFPFLDAETEYSRTKARERMDLLVKRAGSRPPLIVELKTGGAPMPRASGWRKWKDEVNIKYGCPAVNRYGRSIECRIVYVSFDFDVVWGDRWVVTPEDAAWSTQDLRP